jgi:carboxypeptidase family protein
MRAPALAVAALMMLLAGVSAPAQRPTQSLRGTVRDSATGQPILGAVLIVRDSAGRVMARTLSGDRGQFRIRTASHASRVQLLRIGFRPRDVPVPAPSGAVTQLDVVMIQIPTLLEPVRTLAASRCRARGDAALAFGVLGQARAALLASVVARETNPASLTLVAYKRYMAGLSDSIARQTVRMESAEGAMKSFNATHNALDFVQLGFRHDSAGHQTFHGPDAEVLLDDGFSSGYCFSLARANAARRNQIGLSFSPAARRKGRVDIQGTLWIDTVARKLQDMEFRYLGLDNVTEQLEPGGRVSFREMSNGVVLIDRWSLRIIGAADTSVDTKTGVSVHRGMLIQEVGGELAHARWPDGHEWSAPLGKLRVAVVDHRGTPARGRMIGLDSTDYRAVTDVAGIAELEHLVPGPYRVIVVDPALTPLGITLHTGLEFTAVRDSTLRFDLDAPTAEDFVGELCRQEKDGERGPWLLGRVTTVDGQGLGDVRWRLARGSNGSWQPVADRGRTGASGLFHFCRHLTVGEAIRVEAWREGDVPVVSTHRVSEQITVVAIQLSGGVVGTGRPGRYELRALEGTVIDSSSGKSVSGAHVALVGTPLYAIADSAGRFSVSNVRAGRYMAEIHTWSLDSVGVVGQSPLVIGDAKTPITLYVPTRAQIAASLCVADTLTRASGARAAVVVGHAQVKDDTLPPIGVRVVAEWSEGHRTTRSVESSTDERGAFRLCGVPRDTDINVHVATEGVTSDPMYVRIAPNDALAIADLALSPVVALPSVVTTERITIPSFERNRKLGLGRFMTREQLAQHDNQDLIGALAQISGLSALRGSGGRGWVLSSHVPPHLAPRGTGERCGSAKTPCSMPQSAMANQGIYCPEPGERQAGMKCGCYAQVYVDGLLANPGRPTEPFDINAFPTMQIEAVEFYPGPAQTPIEYSKLNAECGVLVLWTRRVRSGIPR